VKGSSREQWRCGARAHQRIDVHGESPTSLLLAPFSTRIPPELLERLRIAAPQIGLHQSEIATIAIDAFLAEYGF
jgi:hypothetical protein